MSDVVVLGKQRVRMAIDSAMTVLSVILMGGTLLFPSDKVHQVLGMVLLVLWGVHTVLNRRWYGSLFRGSYPPYRIMQVVVNLGILLCAVVLMASGMLMAWFMPVTVGMEFARTAHLLSSYWYYLFMSAHLGMHVGLIFRRMTQGRTARAKNSVWVWRVIVLLVCAYGVYAFVVRGIAGYLFLRQPFFFLDVARGYVLFAVDYLAILVLFAALSHYLGKWLLTRAHSSDALLHSAQ